MRTTPTIDDDVAGKLPDEMAKSQPSMKKVVNASLRQGLRTPRDEDLATPFTVRARPMGLRSGFDLDDIGGLLESLDGVSRRCHSSTPIYCSTLAAAPQSLLPTAISCDSLG